VNSGFSRAVCGVATAFGALLVATEVSAADLPTTKAPEPAPVPPAQIDYFQPFFVKAGFTYALNTSSSKLWAQNPAAMAQGDFATFPLGVNATIGDLPTLGLEGGVFVTRSVSIDVSVGVPYYVDVKTKGYNPLNPILTNGTVLAQITPDILPVTAVYHFDNFGAFRPYLGAGVTPSFSISNKNALLTSPHVGSGVGPVLQSGFNYMLTPNWGLNADVKKAFVYTQSSANGIDIPGVGSFPAQSYQHTHFQPWAFSVGIVYAFGKNGVFPTF
jgi:outer membrane protein